MVRSDIAMEPQYDHERSKFFSLNPPKKERKKNIFFQKKKGEKKKKTLVCTLKADLLPDTGNKAGEVPHRIGSLLLLRGSKSLHFDLLFWAPFLLFFFWWNWFGFIDLFHISVIHFGFSWKSLAKWQPCLLMGCYLHNERWSERQYEKWWGASERELLLSDVDETVCWVLGNQTDYVKDECDWICLNVWGILKVGPALCFSFPCSFFCLRLFLGGCFTLWGSVEPKKSICFFGHS